METIKIKFAGKFPGFKPEQSTVCYWLMKNGYQVEVSEEPDYIICDTAGEEKFAFCKYPQIRIFESGENVTPPFDLVDYAVCGYPIAFGDRNFYQPGCSMVGGHWHALSQKDRTYPDSILEEKPYFANFISSHDSEYENRSKFFALMNGYKRVESPGSFLNNTGGGTVNWKDDSKTNFQRKCKFTICFESTANYGFITEKITDAFYADTIPIYLGSGNITDIFNKDAFLRAEDYPSLEALLERVKELDQDDKKYLEMLRQPIFVDKEYPKRMDEALEKFILHIFQQPKENAYRRSRIYYAKENNDYLTQVIEPNLEYKMRQAVKKILGK